MPQLLVMFSLVSDRLFINMIVAVLKLNYSLVNQLLKLMFPAVV